MLSKNYQYNRAVGTKIITCRGAPRRKCTQKIQEYNSFFKTNYFIIKKKVFSKVFTLCKN